ncbi:MAG TPA: hypothetical protein QF624_01040 [Dehalococcoidia bacterium]|nr:hypothetical protein [Dehalococcoidia bacterium]
MTNSDDPTPGDDLLVEPDLAIAPPPQRVSGMRTPDGWTLPGKPDGLGAEAEDAWRQTGFVLADDLRLIAANLDLQARMAATGRTPGARTMPMAAIASLWSRALESSSDAAGLIRRGSYQSALPLIRQGVELIAGQYGLRADLDEFKRWAHSAYGRNADAKAEEIGLGHYFSGETIAGDEHLRVIYRVVSDFGRPNFGPTALFVADGATHERYPLVFAGQAFHFGCAQLLHGWLLRLGISQLHLAMHARNHFPADEELRNVVVAHVADVEALLADEDRCSVEQWQDDNGHARHLITQFRRQPRDATKRLLF